MRFGKRSVPFLGLFHFASGIRGRQSDRESAGPKIAALTHTRLFHLPKFDMVFSSSLSARPHQCSALS